MTRKMLKNFRRILIVAYLGMLSIIFLGAWGFWHITSQQLWDWSTANILTLTRQGANTLRVQLQNSERNLRGMAEEIEKAPDMEAVMSLADKCAMANENVYLFLPDGSAYPHRDNTDAVAFEMIKGQQGDGGIIEPHINSVTGVNVFDQYVRVKVSDGSTIYVVRQFVVNDIIESVTLEFFDHAGFAYVINTDGKILLRSSNPNSNATARNIFENISEQGENPYLLDNMKQAMAIGKVGWSVMDFEQEEMFFAYRPIGVSSDWYLMAMIPAASINQEVKDIMQAFITLASFVIALFLILLTYIVYRLDQSVQGLHKLQKYRQQSISLNNGRIIQERQMLIAALANTFPVLGLVDLRGDVFQLIYMNEMFPDYMGREPSYSMGIKQLRGLVHPDYLQDFDDMFQPDNLLKRLQEQDKNIWCHVQMQLVDGKYHWASMQVVPMDGPNIAKGVFMSRMVDEEKYKEEQQKSIFKDALDAARSANEAKSQFLSNMSHDIRTPLNAILGMTTIVNNHLEDMDYAREGLRKIDMSGRHLLGLINDILDMSKIESGKISLQLKGLNLAEMLDDTVELLQPQIKASQLNIHVDTTGLQQENVIGDMLRIRQIMLNIMGNAVKYTESGGDIYVTLRDEAANHHGMRMYSFVCQDTGIGIDKGFLESIFDPFERASNAITNKIQGTGLGMPITKNLVELMGGLIQVESQLGKGSVFTVKLPLEVKLTQEEPQEEEKAETPLKIRRDLQNCRVLLVDDNEMNVEIAKIFIEETGATVEVAEDGQKAVDMVAASPENYYQLIFMDIQMPIMDGYKATQEIRKLARGDVEHMPIIALTADAFEEDVIKAQQVGMNGHIPKPVEPAQLKKLVAELG